MLNALEFETTNNSCNALIKALDTLKILNESNKNNLPEDIELEFLNKKWQNHIEKKSGTEKRHYFEIAVMNELKNRIRSGDVSVKNSKNFRNFEDYLIPKEIWNTEKQTTRLVADLCVDKYLSEQQEKLEELFSV
jgi:hypothetical protein